MPIVPKKKKSNYNNGTSSSAAVVENTKFRQRKLQISKQSKGSKSLVVTQEAGFTDVDNIDPSEICDTPRQIILKKKKFPTQLLGIIKSAVRVNFSKDKKLNDREEIVANIQFLFDLTDQKLIRITGEDKEKVDYKGIEIRFHFPKRYQDQFQNITDLSFLIGALIVVPQYDPLKWKNEKDENQSTIPIIMILKNTKCCQSLGIVKEEYPTLSEFNDESAKSIVEGYLPIEGSVFEVILSHFEKECNDFHKRESHVTNRLHDKK